MTAPLKITFLPMNRTLPGQAGGTLLEAAMAAGIHINASCGGNGGCGKCRIKIREGSIEPSAQPGISQEEYAAGVRLACQTKPVTDVVVEVPSGVAGGQGRPEKKGGQPPRSLGNGPRQARHRLVGRARGLQAVRGASAALAGRQHKRFRQACPGAEEDLLTRRYLR